MYRHILIATDGSDPAARATGEALRLAQALQARVTLLCVIEPAGLGAVETAPLADIDFRDAARIAAETTIAGAAAQAKTLGVMAQGHISEHVDVAGAIADAAADAGCDLIAMGSHGMGALRALVLGSVTARVLSASKIPVIVYR